MIDEARVGDRGFTLKSFKFLLLGAVAGGFDFVLKQRIDQGIYATDEETGDGSDMANILALFLASL